MIGFNEGTSNLLVEDENEEVAKEEDATKEEEAVDAVDRSKSKPNPIRLDEPSPHITKIYLSVGSGLEFWQFPYKTPSHLGSLSNVRVLEVGMEYTNKNVFLAALKRHNFKNDLVKEIRQNAERVNTIYVGHHLRTNLRFWVTEYARPNQDMSGASYRVDLSEGTCDYERFQIFRFPYALVIITCANVRIEYLPYINDVYRLENMHNIWRFEFPLILDESIWPLVSDALFKLAPNMNLRCVLKDNPTSTRINTNMDVRERDNQ
ncbi:hypothetical protein PVK06_030510 [Gossypium arboreum]|uniref:Uncharacterized protein n=1 Tax=Gossypium arboreum TaxID=29729 RepID=A0ABR0NPE3_GOSAR|nr:hypothetical protein PVK06_030510 [Gossypium arboreum]